MKWRGNNMQSSYKPYSHLDSVTRIDEILDAPAGNYEEKDSIPSRDTLTFTNGFYVNCTCITSIKGRGWQRYIALLLASPLHS
jgi:hypothetical protein